jgi:hypothetical protein
MMLTDDQISDILLPLMPLKDPYTFARAVEVAVLARSAPVTRNLAVMTCEVERQRKDAAR